RLALYPALVQGTASQRSLVAALRQCDQDQLADVVIVARGGGSFEELMAFNQEAVVRAIQAMRIPVITALGHTSDRTLADLVADREARTPTAAAEIVVPNKADLRRQLGERGQRLQRAGLTALIVPAHQVQLRRQTVARLAGELYSRRRERPAHLPRMLRPREPPEVRGPRGAPGAAGRRCAFRWTAGSHCRSGRSMSGDQSIRYEQALAQLDATLRSLEEGKLSLEEAIGAVARGREYLELCERKLEEAR